MYLISTDICWNSHSFYSTNNLQLVKFSQNRRRFQYYSDSRTLQTVERQYRTVQDEGHWSRHSESISNGRGSRGLCDCIWYNGDIINQHQAQKLSTGGNLLHISQCEVYFEKRFSQMTSKLAEVSESYQPLSETADWHHNLITWHEQNIQYPTGLLVSVYWYWYQSTGIGVLVSYIGIGVLVSCTGIDVLVLVYRFRSISIDVVVLMQCYWRSGIDVVPLTDWYWCVSKTDLLEECVKQSAEIELVAGRLDGLKLVDMSEQIDQFRREVRQPQRLICINNEWVSRQVSRNTISMFLRRE